MKEFLGLATDEDIANAIDPDGRRVGFYVVLAARTFSVRYEDVTDRQYKATLCAAQYGARAKNVRRWPIDTLSKEERDWLNWDVSDLEERTRRHGAYSGAERTTSGRDWKEGWVDAAARDIEAVLDEICIDSLSAYAYAVDKSWVFKGKPPKQSKPGGKGSGKKKHYSKANRHKSWYQGKDHG